jgi:hypothetical protein
MNPVPQKYPVRIFTGLVLNLKKWGGRGCPPTLHILLLV